MPKAADDIQVHPQFRYRLKELRMKANLSLRELAKRASYSHPYIWDLEKGVKQPTQQTAKRLDDALNAGGELATLVTVRPPSPVPARGRRGIIREAGISEVPAFAPDWRQGLDDAADLWRWEVQGRDWRLIPFSAAAYLPSAMRWLTSRLDERPTGTGSTPAGQPHVDTIRQVTATFRTLDNHYGGGHVHGPVVRFLDAEVAPLLRNGQYDTTEGAALFSAAAEMSVLAGWSAYDRGLHGLGQRHLIGALRLAMTAGDRALGAEILAAMSHQAAYLGASDEAIDLARASGRAGGDAGLEVLLAEAAVLEAHGHAVAGDEKSCAVALDLAERTLDRADRHRDPQWIRYFDEAYLSAKFGHCFAALGRGDLAARFASRSLEMDARYVRGKQFNLALLATAHAQSGEVEEAARVGVEAVQAAEGLDSMRAVDYLAQLAARLAVHVGVPAVREFTEQVRPLVAGVKAVRLPSPAAPPEDH